MLVATLERQCTYTLINSIQQKECIHPSIRHALKQCRYEVLTQRVFSALVQNYPSSVTDEILRLFCHGRLERLVLRACTSITLSGLRSALTRCTSVKIIDLSECDQLLSNNLPALLHEHAKDLKILILENCSLKSDLLERLIDLPIEELSVEGCQGLDDNFSVSNPLAGPFFSTSAVHLTTINVSSCQTVTTTFVRYLTAVCGPILKSVNISWSNIDCLALIYLAGYTISPKACFTLKDFISINDSTYQSNLIQLFSPKPKDEFSDEKTVECFDENKDSQPVLLSNTKEIQKSASVYFKDLCAYCSQEVRVRNPSLSPMSSVVDSYEDYDIIASQLVHILDDDRTLTIEDDEIYSDWAILSINDIERHLHCTCLRDNVSSTSSSVIDEPPSCGDSEDAFICQQSYASQIAILDITRIDFFDKEIGWKCLEFFMKSNTSLKEFSTSWSELSNEMIHNVAQYWKDLEFLSFVDCEHVTSDGLSHVASNCKNIKGIDFKGLPFIRDDAFFQFINANENLCRISLAESALTDNILLKLATTHASQITHLDLSWCDNISDDGVVQLLNACKKLRYLDFRQCNVSEGTIDAIAYTGQYLTTLGLCGIKGLNDVTCHRLLNNLPNIVVIDLSWNSSLTDASIRLLLRSCPRLRDVTVAGLKRITSKPLLPIVSEYERWREIRDEIRAQVSVSLRAHNVSGDKCRSKEYMKQLEKMHPLFFLPYRSMNYATNLRKLTLGYCDKMNDTHLSEIVAVCRGTLTIEDYYGEIIKPCWTGFDWSVNHTDVT